MMPSYVAKNAQMEKIADAFSGYIHRHPNLDLLWSEKVGYILLTVNPKTQKADGQESFRTAEGLAYRLFSEIITDVIMETESEHEVWNLDEKELQEIEKRWAPFLDMLPEYGYICDAVLSGNADFEEA